MPLDSAVGAFSPEAPWTVDPAKLVWRRDLASLRSSTRAEVPQLLRRRRVPPGSRVFVVGWRLGIAMAAWWLSDRKKGTNISRAGLSRRLRIAFEKLGPTFIKLGQILSSGEGVFPPELVSEFSLCRDQVPPESFASVRRIVEEDLGKPLNEVFSAFDPVPLAAASIAQVHAATLRTGEQVVVKVQRPTVATMVKRDLATMSWIAPLLVGRIPVTALANPPALVELFAETIVEELDFRLEADNMLDVARVLTRSQQSAIVVPRPHAQLVTRRVLVMERLDGFAWGDAEEMRAAGIDTALVLHQGLVAFLEGVMLYGVFHGDLHGGNLFVRTDGRVALLDFGITGRLNEPERLAFLRLVVGATGNDVTAQLEALRDLGAFPPDIDVPEVIKALGLDRPPLDPMQMTVEQLTKEMRELTKRLLGYGARMPKELMLFVKDLLFLDGAMATMAPDVDLISEIMKVVVYFHEHHGERIAREIGVPFESEPAVDVDAMRAAFGFADSPEPITHSELQRRREVIRGRFEESRDRRFRRRQ
ncbi:MAG: AarF/UbiB family protein [Acidimicrobiales bacterium]